MVWLSQRPVSMTVTACFRDEQDGDDDEAQLVGASQRQAEVVALQSIVIVVNHKSIGSPGAAPAGGCRPQAAVAF